MQRTATAVLMAFGAFVASTTASFAIDARVPAADEPSPGSGSEPAARPAPGSAAAPRTAIPVGLRRLDDQGGARVYFAPVRYGGTVIDSVIETESAVTQVLPGLLGAAEVSPMPATFAMTFGSGASYAGRLVRTRIGIGSVAGPAEFGLVERAGCAAGTPKCAIVDEPVRTANFGYGSFPASLGLSATNDPAHPSVPSRLGFRRYLFSAPRRDETGRVEPGQIVFNPTEDETRGFVPLAMDATPRVPGAVHGCMRNLANGITFCGAIVFDSDFSGIEVFQHEDAPNGRNWSTGDKVKLMFTDLRNTRVLASVDFTVGLATLPIVRFGKPGLYASPVIRVGQVPYLALQVLTDLATGRVGVAARKTPGTDAVGHVP